MKERWIALFLVLSLSLPALVRAEEKQPPANPGTVQAPAQGAGDGQGCMPGGGCCGACQAAAAAATEKKLDNGAAAAPQAEMGGCPCGRNKQKTM